MQRLLGVLDGLVIGPAQASRQSIEAEDNGGIWVDHRSPIYRCQRRIVIAAQGGAYRARHGERQRRIATSSDRHPGQALCRLAVVVLGAGPIHQMTLLPAPSCKCIGERIVGIGLEHQPEQTQRLLIVLGSFGKGQWYRATDQIIDILARLRLAPRALDFGAAL